MSEEYLKRMTHHQSSSSLYGHENVRLFFRNQKYIFLCFQEDDTMAKISQQNIISDRHLQHLYEEVSF